jgi:hypothetical protein
MAIDAVFPTLSTPVQPNSLNVSPEQARLSESSGQPTQIERAVTQAAESEGASEDSLSSGNKEGRGQLVDIKV